MTRKFLDKNEVDYEVFEVDLMEGDERQKAVDAVKTLSGGTSFPVVKIGEEVIVGFNKPRLKELLSL
jgi:glutaredoxin